MTRVEIERIEKLHKSFSIKPLRDKRLSFKARGILYYLLSKPDNWKGQLYDIVNQSEQDGIKAVRSAMKELVKFGYAELRSTCDPKTKKFTGNFYRVYDICRKPPKTE